MSTVVKMEKVTHDLVDIEALGAFAKQQWDRGDREADKAGEPWWFRGAEALEKAKPYVMAKGEETFGEYQERVTGRDVSTCKRHRQAYHNRLKLLDATSSRNGARARDAETISGLTGKSTAGKSHMRRDWTPEVDAEAKKAFREQTQRIIETAIQEEAARRALAKRLIDIGYKVLAKELHPDKGGNREAMVRLSEVKQQLYRCFKLGK